MTVVFLPIGRIQSPYERQDGTPIQADLGEEEAVIEIDEPYREALRDLDGFERIWVITLLDRAAPFSPLVVPYLDSTQRGLFATRSPSRPNPIGISCVRVCHVDIPSGMIEVESVDLLDGTPVLDLKPYVPMFDAFPGVAAGWLDTAGSDRRTADDRFGA